MRGRILFIAILVGLIALGAWQWQWTLTPLAHWIEAHAVLGAVVYVVLVTASIVVLPLSSLSLLPLAARSYGVILTALLSAAGWWLGSLLAFQIARRGRRALERFASLDAIDRLEGQVPADLGFGGIVVLRMTLPVDIVSFALGLFKQLSFRTYAVASLIGILPFAFVWSYAGGQLGAGRVVSFAGIMVVLVLSVMVIRRIWTAHRGGGGP